MAAGLGMHFCWERTREGGPDIQVEAQHTSGSQSKRQWRKRHILDKHLQMGNSAH